MPGTGLPGSGGVTEINGNGVGIGFKEGIGCGGIESAASDVFPVFIPFADTVGIAKNGLLKSIISLKKISPFDMDWVKLPLTAYARPDQVDT